MKTRKLLLLISALFFVQYSHGQICVGETAYYSCPGTSTKYSWSISGGGTMSTNARACTISVTWNTLGTHYVYYSDILNSANDYTYTVYVLDANGGTTNATVSNVCAGGSTTLSLSGHAGNVVRWEQSSNGTNWQPIAHTSTSYTPTNLQATTYFRAILSRCSSQAASTAKLITVSYPQPGSIEWVDGVVAYCTGASGTFTLRWNDDGSGNSLRRWEYSEQSGGTWGSWTPAGFHGINTQQFTVSKPTRIRAIIQDPPCGEIPTGYITAGPIPATVPGYIQISTGETQVCAGVPFSLSVHGKVGSIVQWYTRDAEHTWGNLSSPNNISIVKGHYYKAVIQNEHCATAETPEFYVAIKPVSVGTFAASPVSICPGAPINLSVSTYIGTKLLWQKSENGGTFSTIAETTGSSYQHSGQSVSATFRAVAVNQCNVTATSSSSLVTIKTVNAGTITTSTPEVCYGDEPTLKLEGYSGNIIGWEESDNELNWIPINFTGASYKPLPITKRKFFRAVVNDCSVTKISPAQQISFYDEGTISILAGSTIYCSGESTTFTLGWQDAGNNGFLKRWEYNEMSGGVWGDDWMPRGMHDITTVEFTVSKQTRIRAVIQFPCGEISTGFITTGPTEPTTAGHIETSTGENEVCAGIPFSLSLEDEVGNVIDWQTRDEEDTWGDLGSSSNIVLIKPQYFKAIVQNGNCAPQETVLYVDVKPQAEGTLFPGEQVLCPGETAYFTLSNFFGTSILWQKKDEGSSTWVTVAGTTDTLFNYSANTVSSSWQAVVLNECGQSSIPSAVQVEVLSSIPIPQIEGISICNGDVAVLSVNNPQAPPARYFWYSYSDGVYVEEEVTAINRFEIFDLDAPKTYYVAFEHEGCMSGKSPVQVNVFGNNIVPATPSVDLTVSPYAVSLNKNNPSTANVTYYWQTDPGSFSQDNSADIINMPAEGLYYVRSMDSNGCWSAPSIPVEVINHMPTQYAYPLPEINYVRTYGFSEASTTSTYPIDLDSEPDPRKLVVNTTYFDGFGRQLQHVAKKGSPLQTDVIAPMEYDVAGRILRDYLPFASTATTGALNTNPIADQRSFYQGSEKVSPSYFPFSYQKLERSSLGRPEETHAPGESWAALAGSASSRGVEHHLLTNNDTDQVRRWQFDNDGLPDSPGNFAAGTLFVIENHDEHGYKTVEFKTRENNTTVLKKVQADGSSWADTYYIYDDFGNLICVLPPEAVAGLATEYFFAGATPESKDAFLDRWAFRYKYDRRQRMIEKQVPGAEPIFMVYDGRDRLVLTQDGNQRTDADVGYWTFTKYDNLNRPILTGIKDTIGGLSQVLMQEVVDEHYTKPWATWGEEFNVTASRFGYTNNSYPVVTTGTLDDTNRYLTITYYDNYDFKNLWLDEYDYLDVDLSASINNISYTQREDEFRFVKGQMTGSKVKVLDGGMTGGFSWLQTVNYYDEKYRLIQTVYDNYKGGQERTTNVYDFAGNLLTSEMRHSTNELSWTDLANVKIVGNHILKTTSGSGWIAGAATVETLAAGADGWIECVITETNQIRAFGLTSSNENLNYNTIDYAFWHDASGARIYENGSLKYTLPSPVAPGDIIRIERKNSSVQFYRNGAVIPHPALTSSTSSLIGDVCISSGNGDMLVHRASFAAKEDITTRRFIYDHAGRLTETWHKINSQPDTRIALNEYNEIGQLVDKKLHSSAGGATDARQSIDYRYNIRGWLTKMNEADLQSTEPSDPADYFGFELGYDQDIGLGNAQAFNGNISAMKWSTNMGLGENKMNGYSYGYDPMNRITSALFKSASGDGPSFLWSTPAGNDFSATGYEYDLNGNIMALARKGKNGSDMDILDYDYGTGVEQSNRLLSVSDSGIRTEGFKELAGVTGNDYQYDNNGNLVWDKNKGGAEILTNGEFSEGSASWILEDAAGRFVFENESLTVTAHASSGTLLRQNDIVEPRATYVVIIDMIRTSSAGSVNISVGGKSVNVNATGKSVFTITAGTSKDFRVSCGAPFAGTINSLELKGIVVISYNFLNLPEKITKGSESIGYIYDATGRKLSQEVYDGSPLAAKKTDYVGDHIYENDTLKFINHEEGRVIMAGAEPEYQYHLKDHLGNVRLTFTTKEEVETSTATIETENAAEEQSQFLNYEEAVVVNHEIFDHTSDATVNETYNAMRLAGGTNEMFGLARSISVMPGDQVNMEVWAKYLDPDSESWDGAFEDFLSAYTSGTPPAGSIVDGGLSGSLGSALFPYPSLLQRGAVDPVAPKAFLNWLVFDRDFNPIISESGYTQVPMAARETGDNSPHHRLARPTPLIITQPGYVYIYISNENETPVEVFFDDFKIVHTKSPVVQMDDYYPFGLTFNSYQRENSVENRYLYNQGTGDKKFNTERISELDLNIDLTKYRAYDPAIGRWWQVDPKAESLYEWNPYNYSFNNPIRYNDPFGDCPPGVDCESMASGLWNSVKAVGSFVADTWNSGGQNLVQAAENVNALATLAHAAPEFAAEVVTTAAKEGFVNKIQETGSVNAAVSEMTGEALGGVVMGIATDKGISKLGTLTKVVDKVSDVSKPGNLGNPFKGKTLEQVQKGFEKQVSSGKLEGKYTSPVSGSKSYVNKKSGYSYNVDTGKSGKTGVQVEKPHVDVNYPNPKPNNVPDKKKLPLQ